MIKAFIAGVAVMALAGTTAFGQVWTEQGDAGQLLGDAQHTVGPGALTQIDGYLDASNADLYCIQITDVRNFSATTVGGTRIDTQLFLFDSDGYGVTFDDDDPNGGGLQSTITGAFVRLPGTYYLALAAYNYNATSASGEIWLDNPFNVERAPDGPGMSDPLTGWDNASSGNGSYSIYLTGAGFCEVPAPGAFALLGLGGIAAIGTRRRRHA